MKTINMLMSLMICNCISSVQANSIDIFAAARTGDLVSINRYVEQAGEINVRNSQTYTPFMLASYYGHAAALSIMKDHQVQSCAVDAKGNNALMGVAFKGHVQIAQW